MGALRQKINIEDFLLGMKWVVQSSGFIIREYSIQPAQLQRPTRIFKFLHEPSVALQRF